MALSFLEYGITAKTRKNKKSSPTLVKWNELRKHFENQIKNNTEKLIRETVYAKVNTPDYPMECRLMFGNANVPVGYVGGTTDDHLVKSIPCKNVEQGKETLAQVINAIETDNDVRKIVANFLKGRTGFDDTTIPAELLEG